MFQKVGEAEFVRGEHEVLRFWQERGIFEKLRRQNAGKEKWSFLDGPITANNPMGVHHAWGRTYKDAFQRYFAMTGRELRYQNGFDCQGLWVEVEVEKELNLGTKNAIADYGIDRFVNACKQRVLKFAARQTEQSIRLGYWMDWDDPGELRKLAAAVGTDADLSFRTARGTVEAGKPHELVAQLGNPEWGGSYFTFSTENNETIWTFLKKCFTRGKIYRGHDVMPWSGRAGSAYSQMEVADGRRLSVHRALFVRFPLFVENEDGTTEARRHGETGLKEYLLVWTTTPWTLTSNVACAVNPDLDYVKLRTKRDGAVYYVTAPDNNLDFQRLAREFKEGFGRPEWGWPEGVPKLKTIAQIFKEQGGFEILGTVKGAELIGRRYAGPFDDLEKQNELFPSSDELPNAQENRCIPHSGSAHHADEAWLICEGYKNAGSGMIVPDDDEHESSLTMPDEELKTLADNFPKKLACWLSYMADRRFKARVPDSLPADEALLFLSNLGLTTSTSPHWDAAFGTSTRLASRRIRNDVCNQLRAQYLFLCEIEVQLAKIQWRNAVECHRIIDGGRDSRGNPNVVAGEGTGIVHIAPGCGDIDHQLGQEWGLPSIAPLAEDGTFVEGFGEFTGKAATDPAVVDLVIEKLRAKHMLVAVEEYPHIYPHCWRTGDELVFRLVDEWFINMDWRDEIKEVTKTIDWLPKSIDGQERELEWLSNMRDWMISKKRFWGLALPIWVNPDDPADFEVIGSLAELQERAVEGWDEFAGNTPHRPWIDRVKIKSTKTGAVLSRIQDVGNPWLDAGIVPFSTLNYNQRYPTDVLKWDEWYPAHFVTECFPGQFRNWFYSMLSMATMMRYDETDDPAEKQPFQTLLGHRLVMNEDGKPMHKSDGTAIWFEEAAEQLGVDTMRWMYLAQNPAVDLRFGTRHPDEPVALETPEGRIDKTREGLPTCRVTSKPSDEIRRQILIPLWNSYAFFVNYARLDEFDPSAGKVPVGERPEIDRWILSNLQALIGETREAYESFDSPRACQAAANFIDDLSNWYIRRNRRRFWRTRVESPESRVQSRSDGRLVMDVDKLAAYQTLYEVLVTLTKLLAPAVPFLSERMYGNLVASGEWGVGSGEAGNAERGARSAEGKEECSEFRVPSSEFANPQSAIRNPQSAESVHLCPFPEVDTSLLDPALNQRMAIAQLVVRLGHGLRENASLRVRQPLAEIRIACDSAEQRQAVETLSEVVREELNIKQFTICDQLDELVHYSYKPNLKTLGPKYGKLLGKLREELPRMDAKRLDPLRRGEKVTVEIDGQAVALSPEDVMVSTEQASDWVVAGERGIQVALSTALTPELKREGMARDFIRQVQQLRKDANLEIQDRINVYYRSGDSEVRQAIEEWAEYIRAETLADGVRFVPQPPVGGQGGKPVTIGESKVEIWIEKV